MRNLESRRLGHDRVRLQIVKIHCRVQVDGLTLQ
jgi:hypothetical protein